MHCRTSPARFDFTCDILTVSHYMFYNTVKGSWHVPDLKKTEELVIIWNVCNDAYEWDDITPHLYLLQNLKTVFLINEALLIHGARRVQSGKKCHYTTRGPFWQGEDIARERLHRKGKRYAGRQLGVKFPNICSLRLTPFDGKTEPWMGGIYAMVKNTKD
jgi:hypothetical protein